MMNWKYFPRNPTVAKFVECYWFLEKKEGDAGSLSPKLTPYPAAHLILASTEQTYQYTQGNVVVEGKGCHWIFPHCHTVIADHSQQFQILGIKFNVGALYALKLAEPQSVMDNIVQFDPTTFAPAKIDMPALFVNASNAPELNIDILDGLLLSWCLAAKEDKHSQLVQKILPLFMLDNAMPKLAISQFGQTLHCSQRTIERSFLRVTGMTLKQYQSMIRFDEMLNYLYKLTDEKVVWKDIAADFGFSDQPHLIRYLKNCIGNTPSEYVKQRDLTIDVYGDFE